MAGRRNPVSSRGRPAKPPLSRDGVISVAMRVLREEGLDRVTMRRLAQELDTGPASLYVYVANAAELHGALLDELLAGFDFAREDLAELLHAYAELLLGYPSLARSMLSLWPTGPNYLRLIDRILALLARDGVPLRQAAWGVDVLLQAATALAAEHGTRNESGRSRDEGYLLVNAIEDAVAEEYPALVQARSELFSGSGCQRTRWHFEALIQGIASTSAP
jgi:AcrR family transcriptional regulator